MGILITAVRKRTHNVNVTPGVCDGNELPVMREAECIDGITISQIVRYNRKELRWPVTHSQTVMVRAQIQSDDRSKRLTIESLPPDARYLHRMTESVSEHVTLEHA